MLGLGYYVFIKMLRKYDNDLANFTYAGTLTGFIVESFFYPVDVVNFKSKAFANDSKASYIIKKIYSD